MWAMRNTAKCLPTPLLPLRRRDPPGDVRTQSMWAMWSRTSGRGGYPAHDAHVLRGGEGRRQEKDERGEEEEGGGGGRRREGEE